MQLFIYCEVPLHVSVVTAPKSDVLKL